jgi:hypothetical protein
MNTAYPSYRGHFPMPEPMTDPPWIRSPFSERGLTGNGIPEDRISASGAGSSIPLVKCESESGRAKQIVCLQPNRRVEIILRGVK